MTVKGVKTMQQYCDLHTHSIFSDGTDTPQEILQTAVNANGGIPMQQDLLMKHFNRKHGPNAYYGQKKK